MYCLWKWEGDGGFRFFTSKKIVWEGRPVVLMWKAGAQDMTQLFAERDHATVLGYTWGLNPQMLRVHRKPMAWHY